jgi:hypothetical protein
MHTPGPWEVRWGCNVFAKRADTGSEGVVAACGGHSSNKVACRPENEANARLVAAAPDLLAACEELLASVRRIAALNGGGYMRDDSARCERAQAAIDRAKS